ncbi:hypothetical protein [Allomuricauda sp. M10]|nr:hypothetical protein [Muricauda sp. M10]
MKKKNVKKEPIEIQLVYTQNNQVFTKNDQEEWLPVSFQWVTIPFSK